MIMVVDLTKKTHVFQQITQSGRAAGINKLDVQKARDWYRDKAREIKSVNVNRVLDKAPEYRLKSTMRSDMIGEMFLFQYDAKWKRTLPYYDQSPLIFPIEMQGDGRFLGINFHYISYLRRAQLMNALYTVAITENSRVKKLNISYGILKGAMQFSYYKPCVKSYLTDHVQSRFLRILPSEWDSALFLPLARFVGASQSKVWYDSNAKIRG
jgi:hypothetical protein